MANENTSSEKVTAEIFKLQPDALLEFFEIDFSNLQADFSMMEKQYKVTFSSGSRPVYRFTSNINNTNPVFWQGVSYQPLPVSASGFEIPSDGRLPRPRLRIANPSGLLSTIVSMNYDFHGCRVTRKRTFAKFLDDENFPLNETQFLDVNGAGTIKRNQNADGGNPFGAADPNSHLPDEVYYIYRKTTEDRAGLEFELASILEVEDIKFPGRQMLADHCTFRYRGPGCKYKGCAKTGPDGELFSNYGIYQFSINGTPLSDLNPPASSDLLKRIPEWKSDGSYVKGDLIVFSSRLEPQVPPVFVCIKDHTSGLSPSPPSSAEYWQLDACSKTLGACLLRFGADAPKGIRYGGFPAVEAFKHG
jgi:phage-related protein